MKRNSFSRLVAGAALAASTLVVPGASAVAEVAPSGSLRQADASEPSDPDDELRRFAEMTTDETIVPLSPGRFADTRADGETIDDRFEDTGRVAARGLLEVEIGGRGGVPTDAAGVVVNVTAVRPEARGYLTVYACQTDRPLASSVNFVAGVNVGNELVAGLAADGTLCVFASSSIDITVDVVGFIPAGSSLSPVVPSRLLDTRSTGATIDGDGVGSGATTPGVTTRVDVAGRGPIPATADAVIANVTAVRPDSRGFLRTHPCLATPPDTSTVNYVAGTNRANEVVLDLDGNGDVCIETSTSVHLIVDVVAYLPAGTNLKTTSPVRLVDTRETGDTVDDLFEGAGRRARGSEYRVTIGGRGSIPTDARAAILNLTVVRPATRGYVTMHPCNDPRPLAASINYAAGITGASELIASLDATGDVCVYTSGDVHLVIDGAGYIAALPPDPIEADLSIVTVDDIDPIDAGETLTYTTTVSNAGPDDASGVTVMTVLPAGVAFVSTSGCVEDPNGIVSCTLGDVAAGADGSFTIEVAVDSDADGTITADSAVMSDAIDPDTSNNMATEDTVVEGFGSITIAEATTPAGGTGFGYTDDIVAPNAFSLDDGQTSLATRVVPGTYTVVNDDPAPFSLASIVCDDAASAAPSTVDVATRTATVELEPGEDITCTFTHDINLAPTITSAATATVAENQTSAIDVESTDDFDAEAAGLVYSLTGGADRALFAIDAPTGVVTFIAAPDFESPGDVGADNVYDVQVTVTDSGSLSDVQDIAITVTNVNEAPEITSDGGGGNTIITVDENSTAVTDVFTTDDSDSEGAGLTYSLTGGIDQAFFTVDATTGVVTFLAAPDFETPLDDDGDNTYVVTVTVTDSGLLTDTQTMAVQVEPVDDAPVITSDGGGATASVAAAENQTAVTDVDATDPEGETEGGGGLTYSLTTVAGGGVDNGVFTLNAATGVLTFTAAPDFESPGDADTSNDYEVQVTVTDSGGLVDVQDITVDVTDVNESPVITSDGGAATTSVNAAENQTAVTDVQATDDADAEGSGLTYSLTTVAGGGVDNGVFTLNAATGVLTFTAAPDFESPDDADTSNDYEVQVTVTDSGGLVDVQDITVDVTDVNEAPTAVDDSYTGQPVNVRLDAGGTTVSGIEVNDTDGVLSKGTDDSDPEGTTPTVTMVDATAVPGGGSASITTTQGGSVTMNSDGTFNYVSAVGEDAATDSFAYTISDGSFTATATVTITLGDTIWFVDQPTVGGGANDGRSTSPFESLGDFNAANDGTPGNPADGDTIFLLAPVGGAAHADGATLRDDQVLVGQGAGLTSGNLVIAAGTTPVVAPATGDGIGLAMNNTVRGLDIGDTPLGHGMSGGSVGAPTISDVAVFGTGGIFEVTIAGDLDAVAFDSLVSTGGSPAAVGAIHLVGVTGTTGFAGGSPTIAGGSGQGISISNATAPVVFTGGSITNTAGNAIDIEGGSAAITIPTAVVNGAARSVEVTNRLGGTITISGSIDDNAAGINLTSNTGATISFTGGLDLDTAGTNTAFNATGGGTVTVTGTNTIGSTGTPIGGIGINIADTTIGSLGVTFQNVDVNGAANGIVLDDTGSSGGLTVTGDAGSTPNASGGTIANTTGDGIALNNTSAVSIDQLALSTNGRHGVVGLGVAGFSLTNSTATNVGNANDENVFEFRAPTSSGVAAITGTLTLDNVDVTDFHDSGLIVYNESGSLTVDIDESDFDDNDDVNGVDAIFVESAGTASVAITVDGGTFNDLEGDAVVFEAGSTGSNDIDVTGILSTNGGGPDAFPNGGGIELRVDNNATMTFDIKGNTIVDMAGDALIISSSAGSGGGNFTGTVGGPNPADTNTFSGSSLGDGIALALDGPSSGLAERNHTILIENNDIGVDSSATAGGPYNGLGDDGIQVLHRDSSGTLNLTVLNNTIANTGSEGIRIFSDQDLGGGVNVPDNNVRIEGNTFTNIALDSAIFVRLRDTAAGCFDITNNSGTSLDGTALGEILLDNGGSLLQIPQTSVGAVGVANNNSNAFSIGTITFNTTCTTVLP